MARSERIFSKIQDNDEFIGKQQSPRRGRRISDWFFMDSEERQRYEMKIIERTRIAPNEKSIINISMKNNQRCGCNCRRLNTARQVPRRRFSIQSGRKRYTHARRQRVEWLNRMRNSGIGLLTRSDEEISDDEIKKRYRKTERKYKKSRECPMIPFIDRVTSRKLKQAVSTFMSETSLHGIKQTWHGPPLRRLFYMCLVVSMTCFLAYVLIETFVDYCRFPYNQQYTASINNELTFPGITVCNINNFRLTQNTPMVGNLTAEEYYNKYYDSINLLRCKFGERNCSHEWLNKFLSIQGEENLCLVFNVVLNPLEKEPFKISKLGILNGLSVVFALNPRENEQISYGVIVYLHEPTLLPTEYEATFVAAPGYSTYAVVNPEKVTVLGNPYRSEVCSESPPYGYSLAQCKRNCAYNYVESQCKCQLPFVTENRLRKCLVKEIPCIKRKHSNFLEKSDLLEKCNCVKRCSSMLYHTQISTAYRPSNTTLPNHVEINIYYQTLVMKEVKEVPKYSMDKIISQFGGQMGIFLGSSIVTVCEIMELTVKLILETLRHAFSKRPFFHRDLK